MKRVDAPGHLANQYTNGDPVLGIEPTQIAASEMNAVFEEIINVIEGAGLPLNSADDTQLLTAIGILVDALGVQIVDNGWFSIWQRFGTPQLSPGEAQFDSADSPVLLCDRWFFDAGITSGDVDAVMFEFVADEFTYELGEPTRGATGSGAAEAGKFPGGYMQWDQTAASGAGRPPSIYQKHPGVEHFAGKFVTFSFVARVTSGTLDVIPKLTQYFGTGGGASPAVKYAGSAHVLDTTFTRFTFTQQLGTLIGKTLSGATYLQMKLEFEASTTFTLEIFDVRLDLGSTPRPVVQRSFEDQLEACFRYYWKSWAWYLGFTNISGPGTSSPVECYGPIWSSTDTTEVLGMQRNLPVQMRTTTGSKFYNVIVGTPTVDRVTIDRDGTPADVVVTSSSVHWPGMTPVPILVTSGADDALHTYHAHVTIEAEVPDLDVEL